MASPSHPFRALGALLAAWVLTPVAFLGVVGAVSDSGPMRPLWAAAGLAGVLGVGGALHTVWDVVRAGREEAARVRDARGGGLEPVARWRVDRSEARRFAEREWASRKVEVVGGAAGVLVLGTGFLWATQDGPPWAAFAAAAFVAALWLGIGLGKYGLEYQKAVGGGGDDVIVFPDSVVVLGVWHALGGDRRLTKVELADDALELTVEWTTSKGATAHDTIRVPVPADARGLAEEAASFLRRS